MRLELLARLARADCLAAPATSTVRDGLVHGTGPRLGSAGPRLRSSWGGTCSNGAHARAQGREIMQRVREAARCGIGASKTRSPRRDGSRPNTTEKVRATETETRRNRRGDLVEATAACRRGDFTPVVEVDFHTCRRGGTSGPLQPAALALDTPPNHLFTSRPVLDKRER